MVTHIKGYEKKYECSACGYKSLWKSNMDRHIKKHEKEEVDLAPAESQMQVEEPDDVMIIYDQLSDQQQYLDHQRTQVQSDELQHLEPNYGNFEDVTEIKKEINLAPPVSQMQIGPSEDVVIIHDRKREQQQQQTSVHCENNEIKYETQMQSASELQLPEDLEESNISIEKIEIEEHDVKFEPIQEFQAQSEFFESHDYFYLQYLK